MFDEPSLGLAPTIVQDVLRTIRELNREGLTCLLVEQNVAVSLKLAATAYVLENGHEDRNVGHWRSPYGARRFTRLCPASGHRRERSAAQHPRSSRRDSGARS